jgi:hypothetical protein
VAGVSAKGIPPKLGSVEASETRHKYVAGATLAQTGLAVCGKTLGIEAFISKADELFG